MVGVFDGHLKATPRLPLHDGGLQAAEALWSAATEILGTQWPDPQ